MRPSTRLTLIAVLLSTILLGGLWWLSATAPPEQPPPPLALQPTAVPLSAPEEAKVNDALDRLEEAETERFGASEAARRRRTREEIVKQRRAPEASGSR